MRIYKEYIIPNRKPRNGDDIQTKQTNYCNKSDCKKKCATCLFSVDNIWAFKEWYLTKNKKPKKTTNITLFIWNLLFKFIASQTPLYQKNIFKKILSNNSVSNCNGFTINPSNFYVFSIKYFGLIAKYKPNFNGNYPKGFKLTTNI